MKKLGFGFLRLPKNEAGIDKELLSALVDEYISLGGDYFDTAYTYLRGQSEECIRDCVVRRYPRESFRIADKLPGYKVREKGDCERFFRTQLERCGVSYFDVFMLHWLNPENYAIAEKFDEFGFLKELRHEGLAREIGFSYHGDAALLDRILTEHPELDYVQLQINYLDWKDPAIEAEECYKAAVKHGKKVIVMEPVKGGTLARLPDEAAALLSARGISESPASLAIRFAAELPAVERVLSGMNAMEQIRDNMRHLPPLTQTEHELLGEICKILNRSIAIACTGCRYCEANCPKGIPIPDYFAIYNSYCRSPDDSWKMSPVYERLASGRGRASDCIACRQCEQNCPQRIEITKWLPKIAEVFEKK